MSYQRKRWERYGLLIGDHSLSRDYDLVPAIAMMHDAAAEFWDAHPEEFATTLYFDAVKKAGLGPLSETIGGIQRQRSLPRVSETPEVSEDWHSIYLEAKKR